MSRGEQVELLRWTPSSHYNSMVIPKLKSESPEAAIEAFLTATARAPELSGLIIDIDPKGLASQSKQNWEVLDTIGSKAVLVVANRHGDHLKNDSRIQEFDHVINGSRLPFLLIPVGASLRLTESVRTEFHNLLANTFRITFFIGGSDVDPSHYNEETTDAKDTNYLRDSLEISLAKDIFRSGVGRLFGVCRGAQLIAVALGYKLTQEVHAVIGSTLQHGSGLPGGVGVSHEIIVEPTIRMWIANMAGLVGKGVLKVIRTVVNSFHHQAIIWRANGPLVISGRAPDGTIEWMESLDGRVILRQDHPEKAVLSPPDVRFFRELIQSSSLFVRIRCANLL
ncbi:MAG: gamma-glutamyl-gamma-aminobutyrate hydrolase family protein [Bdellovibrionaceae bacterium]|nr:gamma-glutamyl-gamma-aminobutyrate hydrolase family protein [Pseudobdellovibrionaceae bacterium]